MKYRFNKCLVALVACCVTNCSIVRADIVIGGFLPKNVAGLTVERYSDSGVYLGRIGFSYGENVSDVVIDSSGIIFTAANTVGSGTIGSVPGIVRPTAQYALPGDIQFGWSGHLFATSEYFYSISTSLTGVLEFDVSKISDSKNPYIRNAIPSSGNYIPQFLAFDSSRANSSAYLTGSLYVGSDGNPNVSSKLTERYLQNKITGAIVKDNSFSLPAIGPMAIKTGDHTLFLATGSSVGKYDPTTGNFLGNFLTAPAGNIKQFEFAGDNSVYVLSNVINGSNLYHFSSTGTFLGTTFAFTPGTQFYNESILSFALLAVPEPISVAFMTPCLFVLFGRYRANSSGTEARKKI